MDYMDVVNNYKRIEDQYDVLSIKYKGVPIWPYLRVFIQDALTYHFARGESSKSVGMILKNLFAYNPFVIFKKHDFWSHSSVITRKEINGIYHHHVSGVLCEMGKQILYFEKPEAKKPHFKKKVIPEKDIVSNSWSIALTFFYAYISNFFKLGIIENEELLVNVIASFGIEYDYRKRLRILLGQRFAAKVILKLAGKPKAVFIEAPYVQMGTVWALHENSIPVIEFQHGVLNDNHYAYCTHYPPTILSPDKICVYGDQEYNYFMHKQYPYCLDVVKTGLYILDKTSLSYNEDIFREYRGEFKKIIVVAGQTEFETEFFKFIEEVADSMKDTMFIYIPRRKTELFPKCRNVKVIFGVNIYVYLKWCDIHCTISSTTCLESHYFKKPTIFYMINETPREYYGDILTKANGAHYVYSKEEYMDAVTQIESTSFVCKELFYEGNINRVKYLISSL